jgi:hypothetical protein
MRVTETKGRQAAEVEKGVINLKGQYKYMYRTDKFI